MEQLAIDLPKFMESSSKDKANTLLQIIGVGDKLYELEKQEQEIYNKRLAIGQISDQKKKFAKEMTYYPDAPKEPISAGDLIKQQQDILTKNGENQRKRQNLALLESQATELDRKINDLKIKLLDLQKERVTIKSDIEIAQKSALDLQDESTEALEKNINDIDAVNRKVRANLDKDKAEEDAMEYDNQYKAFTTQIDTIRQSKIDLLKGAPLPLPGLSVVDGELVYMDKKWDNMSGSDQLKVSTAIVRNLNPKCGFVLLDKLEQMDLDTLKEFGEWLEAEGLQAIATRVSTGDECSVIISDGYIEGADSIPEQPIEPTWKAGEF